MIYIFEGVNNAASIIYGGEKLSNDIKDKAVKLDQLPDPVIDDKKEAVLKVNTTTGEVWYEYIDKTPDVIPKLPPTLEDQVAELQQQNLVLMDALATIYEELLLKEVL